MTTHPLNAHCECTLILPIMYYIHYISHCIILARVHNNPREYAIVNISLAETGNNVQHYTCLGYNICCDTSI